MANEKRLIEAYTLAEEIESLNITVAGKPARWNDAKHSVLRIIAEQPDVDAVEVVHGRWVDRYSGKYANPVYDCSECKKPARYKCEVDVLGNAKWMQDLTNYCPNCGAKMDGGNHDS